MWICNDSLIRENYKCGMWCLLFFFFYVCRAGKRAGGQAYGGFSLQCTCFQLPCSSWLLYNTCSRINLVRRDRTDWFIHRFLIPCVPSTYVPYIFQNVLLLVVLWAQWENIVAKCVTFKVRIIDLKPVSPIESTVKKRKLKRRRGKFYCPLCTAAQH